MGMFLFEELIKLYENELYSNAIELSHILLTKYNTNRNLSSPELFVLHIILGDSLKEEKNYLEAIEIYEKVIHKSLLSYKA